MPSVARTVLLFATLAILASAQAPAAIDESAADQASPAANQKLQEVTVTARRKKLEKKVQKFVRQIVVPENGGVDGIARWQAPTVCPLVSGLTRQAGEFILERLSQIGRQAGIPLAGEHCRPNLYVLVTAQPADLLKLMEKRNRPFTFGYDDTYYPHIPTSQRLVDDFIDTPRAVRVWYNSATKDPSGHPLSFCELKGRMRVRTYVRCGKADNERATLSAMTTFSRVFVIADRTRLHAVKLGQLADYVAMVGFAKLRPGAHLGDAPTILKLFNGPPQAAPTSMTTWDQAFLKSLYATDQTSKAQPYWISHDMVNGILH